MKIISNKYIDWILNKLKVNAITLYPVIFIRTSVKKNKIFLNHENII
jgi:hypothetical protein